MSVPCEIVEYESLKFVGLKTQIRSSLNSANNLSQIPVLWQALRPQLPALEVRVGEERYALITGDLPPERQNEASYYALVEVKNFRDVPSTLIKLEFENVRLARFWHRGPPQSMESTVMKVLTEWLSQSGETLAENMELIIYPPGYDRNDPDSEFQYALFLK